VLASPLTVVGLALLMALAYATLFLPKPWVDYFTFEDGVWESMGALAIFSASITMILLWRRSRGRETRLYQIALLCLAAIFFLIAGEEVAWGQHFLHWPTPADLDRYNNQHETTLHNIRAVNGDANRAFNAFWFAFGVLVPLLAALDERARRFLRRNLPVFPLWLAALLLLNYAFSKGVRGLPSSLYHGSDPLGHRTRVTEIREAWAETLFFVGSAWLFVGEPGESHLLRRGSIVPARSNRGHREASRSHDRRPASRS